MRGLSKRCLDNVFTAQRNFHTSLFSHLTDSDIINGSLKSLFYASINQTGPPIPSPEKYGTPSTPSERN